MTTKRIMKGQKYEAAAPEASPEATKDDSGVWQKDGSTITVNMVVASPAQPWLEVTSAITGLPVYLPLPIRIIQEAPARNGAPACRIVRGAHGDEATATESVEEILGRLSGYRVRSTALWALAE